MDEPIISFVDLSYENLRNSSRLLSFWLERWVVNATMEARVLFAWLLLGGLISSGLDSVCLLIAVSDEEEENIAVRTNENALK